MSQLSFSDAEGQAKRKQTRREKFLAQMDTLIPWRDLERLISPHYAKSPRGRKPYPLSSMLRIHCMQLFYNLSDPMMEDTLYEVESMRRFASISLDKIPDETTILNFRHLLEKHQLGEKVFKKINHRLSQKGLSFKEGTIVDASIIEAPSSTKNREKQRDPEMHQAKKGNQWHFGMKMHVGVDECLGVIHSLETTAAHVHDLTPVRKLLHGQEKRFFGDAGYQGIHKRDAVKDLDIDWNVAMRKGKRKHLEPHHPEFKIEKIKASIRAKVEHVFKVIKCQFGYRKVRYRGLAKNTERLYWLSGFANLLRCRRWLA